MNLINDLMQAGVITADDAQQLVKHLQREASNSKILATLYTFMLDKAFPEQSKGGFRVTLYKEDPNLKKKDINVDKPNILLLILLSHQIITDEVYKKLHKHAIPDTADGNVIILHLAGELTAYAENFTIEQQLAFANTLLGERKPILYNGILNEEQFEQLKADIYSAELDTYLDFFNYSYCCTGLRMQESDTERQVIDVVTPALNKLIYDSFSIRSIEIEQGDFNGHPTYDNHLIKILLDTGVRKYKRSYTCTLNTNINKISNNQLVENILLLVNDVLADFAAPYRFTVVTNKHHPLLFPTHDDRYMLCRLDRQQQYVLDFYNLQRLSLFSQPRPNFNEVLSYRHIEYLIYHFNACGLLNHLSKKVVDDVTDGLHKKTYQNADQLLAAFPGTSVTVTRYPIPNHPPYAQILQAFSAMAGGAITFTDIEDNTPTTASLEDEITYEVNFQCNGVRHSVECQYYYGEFNETVLHYISRKILNADFPDLILQGLIFDGIDNDAYTLVARKQQVYLLQANISLGISRF
ncbi:hypothetical protein [Mucilaginibacter sp. CSA2-8R]|uniref:hypothetical protein n=1 Tax=Mucilaginibacter sp. CSA2-8R TaxID=3141542 RepID=UPI00315DF66F